MRQVGTSSLFSADEVLVLPRRVCAVLGSRSSGGRGQNLTVAVLVTKTYWKKSCTANNTCNDESEHHQVFLRMVAGIRAPADAILVNRPPCLLALVFSLLRCPGKTLAPPSPIGFRHTFCRLGARIVFLVKLRLLNNHYY